MHCYGTLKDPDPDMFSKDLREDINTYDRRISGQDDSLKMIMIKGTLIK